MRSNLRITLSAGLILLGILFSLSNLTCSSDPVSSGGGEAPTTMEWERINPYPTASYLTSVCFSDDRTCWAVGSSRTSLMSSDGGQTWQPTELNGVGDFRGVQFVDRRHGRIVAGRGYMYSTSDGGRTWEEMYSTSLLDVMDFDFVSPSHGWAARVGSWLYETRDGGRTWERLGYERDTALLSYPVAIDLVDDARGYVIENQAVAITSDGGKSWTRVGFEADSIAFLDMWGGCFARSGVGVVTGYYGTFDDYRIKGFCAVTTDGGISWRYPLLDQYNPKAFLLRNERVAVLGSDARLRIIDPFDLSVTMGVAPFLFASLAQSEDGRLVAVGSGGQIATSADEGSSWQTVSTGMRLTIKDLHFLDELNGFAAAGGLLLHTRDGGLTWDSTTAKGGQTIDFVSDRWGWASNEAGDVYRTYDGGETWELARPLTQFRLYDLAMIDSLNGWNCGFPAVMRTWDGGEVWTVMFVRHWPNMRAIAALDTASAWVVGNDGKIYFTEDGGYVWDEQISGTDLDLTDVWFFDDSVGICVGDAGTILRTTDGGQRWQQIESGTEVRLSQVYFLDEQLGWATGSYGIVIRTYNGGKTWRTMISPSAIGMSSVFFIDPATGWAGGGGGELMRSVR